jgi:hypothetical protein
MNQEFDQIVEDDCEFQIEAELYELRRKFMELKEDRKKSAKDCMVLENKLKVLTMDEQKVNKRTGNEIRIKEERELVQSKLAQEKERLLAMKKINDNELKLKKGQIGLMRENIKNVVTNWKGNLAEKNKSESLKLKMIREENEKFINSLKQEEEERNKQQCIQIKSSILSSADKRKKMEQEKKLKMKQMLEAKIAEEMNMKNVYEEKMTSMEELETVMNEKKKLSNTGSQGIFCFNYLASKSSKVVVTKKK